MYHKRNVALVLHNAGLFEHGINGLLGSGLQQEWLICLFAI